MREIGRIAAGYFRTPDRVVDAVSRLLEPPDSGLVTLFDPSCGEGLALDRLVKAWQPGTKARIVPTGIELEHNRAEKADAAFKLCGGKCTWSAMEDCSIGGAASLQFHNPPYDRVRGVGRLETDLFHVSAEWTERGGHLVLIVPDYVLADRYSGLSHAVDRHYEMIGLWKFPDPEYKVFNQCVFIGVRRPRAQDKRYVNHPSWALDAAEWPVLPDNPKPIAKLRPVTTDLKVFRHRLSPELLAETAKLSPLRGALLREAMAPAPKPEPPLLPMKDGHLALALAGGLCDGIVERDGVRFLLKGTLATGVRKVSTKEKFDGQGRKVGEVDTMRTVYKMNVRCLTEDGSIEQFSSHEDATDAVLVSNEQEETA